MVNSSEVIHKSDVKEIPKNSVYVGRKSPYWNSFLDDKKYTTNEACSFHRLFLYRDLIRDESLILSLKKDMSGKKLLCDCELKNGMCHADNFEHIMKKEFEVRTYKETVIHYLMVDLRRALEQAIEKNNKRKPDGEWLYIYFALSELKLSISEIFDFCKKKKIDSFTISKLISLIVIDVESSLKVKDVSMMKYFINHADWMAVYFFSGFSDRRDEPILPETKTTSKMGNLNGS